MALHNDVFRQQIWEFFQNDMDSCLEVAKDKQIKGDKSIFKGGLNFTAALTLMAVVEMCASYFVGREVDDNAAAKFIKEYLSKYEPIFQFEPISKKFFQIFRHGLAHNWSPKMAGVSMDFNEAKSIVFVNGVPVLNVPAFYSVLKRGISDFENKLDDDAILSGLFKKRYDEIISRDKTEVDKLKEMLKI